jgi:hypothetical protein
MYMLAPVLAGPVEPVAAKVVRKRPNGADEWDGGVVGQLGDRHDDGQVTDRFEVRWLIGHQG